MVFEPNRGQARESTRFLARSSGYLVQIEPERVRLGGLGPRSLDLEMELVGAALAEPRGVDPQPGRSHYLIGALENHLRDIPHFAKVELPGVYPGIDVVYRGNGKQLEYDFVVAPGARPEQIRLRFRGQTSLAIEPDGDLLLRFDSGEWRQPKPVLYQLPERTPVEGRFTLAEDGTVGFSVPAWDRSRTLVIDPTLQSSTYLGGSGTDEGEAVAVDANGAIYVSGRTRSANFPTVGPYQATLKNTGDAFVTKYSSNGASIIYSTYLGGAQTGVDEHAYGIAVDASGRAWITGDTWSTDFPTLASPLNGTCSAKAFLTRLTAAGNALDFSICIPGTRTGRSVRLDGASNVYVAGEASSGLPVVNAAQAASAGSTEGFVGKLNAAASAWVYLTYLGGSSIDDLRALAVDSLGAACVTGATWSSNFPVLNPLQPTTAGAIDAFLVKYNASGVILFSSYLGGTLSDDGRAVAIDSSGNCYVTGSTFSSNFPLHSPYQNSNRGGSDAFVTGIDPVAPSFRFSTYLGGASSDVGQGIVVGPTGVVHVAGDTPSSNFPVANAIQPLVKDFGSTWRSTDTGATFTRSALADVSVTSIAVDPTNAQRLYAGTTDGVYRSTNGGTTWVRSDSGWIFTSVLTVEVDPLSPCTVYAGIDTQDSLFERNAILRRSVDCGVTWAIPVFSHLGRKVFSISPSFANPPVVYYSFERNSGFPLRGVARSTNSGVEFSYPGPGGFYRVATDPANSCTAYATETIGSVYKNTSCATWNWSTIGSGLGWLTAIAVHPTNQATVLVGNDIGQIHRKPDAANPFQLAATLIGEVTAIVYHPSNASIVYASTKLGSVYKSTNGGSSWTLLSALGEISDLATTAAAPNNVYAGTPSNPDVFYTRFSSTGALLDSTYFGGRGSDTLRGLALQPPFNWAVLAGATGALDFPVTAGVPQASPGGGSDAFLARIIPNGPCPDTVVLQPTSASFPAGGGSSSVGITADVSCGWTAASNAPWITVTGGSSGFGNGNVNYTVAPNATGSQRIGSMTISGKTFSITQSGPGTNMGVGVVNAGHWRLDVNRNGALNAGADRDFLLGWAGVTHVTGDWNGDGRDKAGVFINGFWYLDYDGNGVWDGGAVDRQFQFGWTGVTPFVGDWNGDGKDSAGIYINGFWFLDADGDGVWDGPGSDIQAQFGWNGVTPFVADWNGDGRDKIGIFINGFWYMDYNGNALWDGPGTDRQAQFGWNGVTPLVGDWSGDGKETIGVYINGFWFLDADGDGLWDGPGTDIQAEFGSASTTPVPGDWNGDGRDKIGIFSNGTWYLDHDGSAAWNGANDKAYSFGQAGDLPLVGAW